MPDKKPSEILAELGFEHLKKSKEQMSATYESLDLDDLEISDDEPHPEHERPALLAEGEPAFATIDATHIKPDFVLTVAHDETGQGWSIQKIIDLEPYGFTDIFKPRSIN